MPITPHVLPLLVRAEESDGAGKTGEELIRIELGSGRGGEVDHRRRRGIQIDSGHGVGRCEWQGDRWLSRSREGDVLKTRLEVEVSAGEEWRGRRAHNHHGFFFVFGSLRGSDGSYARESSHRHHHYWIRSFYQASPYRRRSVQGSSLLPALLRLSGSLS
jgi:hypothetical protein